MKKLRIKNKYLHISLLLLFGFMLIFYILDDPNILRVIFFGWYPEPEFSSAAHYFNEIYLYDNFVRVATKPLQLILPILSIIPVIHYKEEVKHYFEHLFVRGKKYKKEIITSLLENSLLIAVSFYIVYVLFIAIGYFVLPISDNEALGLRDVLEDVLNPDFVTNHVFVYFALVGFFQILLPAFFYSLFAMSVLIYSSRKNMFLFIPVIYHFIMMFVIPIISTFFANNIQFQKILTYFAPQVLLAPSGLSDPSMIMLLIGFVPYLIICLILIVVRLRGKEVIGTNE